MLAVPGEITSGLSSGTNALLRLGAIPVTCADDVLEAIGIVRPEPLPAATPDGHAATALAALEGGAETADEIVRATNLSSAAIAAALTMLELAGLVECRAGVYRR